MNMHPNLSIIIPVYNEEKSISPLFQSLKKELDLLDKDYEIIFVDDGSTDSTLNNLRKFQKKIKVVILKKNKGLSHALEEGFSAAKGEVIVTLDGDLQNDPSDIPKLIKRLKDYDVVCGWRYDRKDSFLIKRLPSKVFNLIVSALFSIEIHDSSCTLRAYKKHAIHSILPLKEGYHRFIPLLLSMKGYKVGEVKAKHNARMYDKAKYNSPLRFLQCLKTMLHLKFTY